MKLERVVINRVILVNQDRALIVRNSGNEFWSLPGGKQDEGEDAIDGARREINEELNIAVNAMKLVGHNRLWKNSRVYDEYYWRSEVDDDQVQAITPDTGLEGELDEIAWIDSEAIETIDVYPRDLIKDAIVARRTTDNSQ